MTERSSANQAQEKSLIKRTADILQRYFIYHSSYLVLTIWCGILVLSALKVLVVIPPSYFDDKHNILNQYYVKWCWGWMLIFTGSYVLLTSVVYGCDSWKKSVICALTRLIVATSFWHLWVNIVFRYIENITGVCLDKAGRPNFDITDKSQCKGLKGSHYWDGFDISGHCFILTYFLLLANSELQLQKRWNELLTFAASHVAIGTKTLSNLKLRFKSTQAFVNFLFVCNCIIISLAIIMLASTCLYFHTFYSKALGGGVAIFSWMVTYNEWYKLKYSPGLPGDGPLRGYFLKSLSKNN